MDEEKVTRAVAGFLNEGGWEVRSINAPFSGRSVWIVPKRARRSKGALIPDILATKGGRLLVVECSAPYKASDEKKLLRYLEPAYAEAIRAVFQSMGVVSVTLAVGMPIEDVHRVRAAGVEVFGVSELRGPSVVQRGVVHSI